MKKLILLTVLMSGIMYSQIPSNSSYVFIYTGTQLPIKCNNGDLFKNALTYVWSKCGPIDTWVDFNTSGGTQTNGTNGQVLVSNGTGGFGTPKNVTQAGAASSLVETDSSGNGIFTGYMQGLYAKLGATPPTVTFGTGGGFIGTEGTAPTVGFPAAGVDGCYFDSTAHKTLCSNNNGSLASMTLSPTSTTIGFFPRYGSTSGDLSAGVQGTTVGAPSSVVVTDSGGNIDGIQLWANQLKAISGGLGTYVTLYNSSGASTISMGSVDNGDQSTFYDNNTHTFRPTGGGSIYGAISATGIRSNVNQGLGVPLTTPGSSSATCVAGSIWADTGFIYVCTATNTIKRIAITTF